MGNEVASTKGAAVAGLASLKQGLQNVQSRLPENVGLPFLRLQTDGDWVFGSDDTLLACGTRAIVNPMSIKHGYVCWTDRARNEGKNELLDERMFDLITAAPLAHEMEPITDPRTGKTCPWKDQVSFECKILDGKYAGTQLLYKTSSRGGINAARGIMQTLSSRLDETDTDYVFPVVEVDHDSYRHASYGKTYVPVFNVVGWANSNGEIEGAEDSGDAERIEHAEEPEAPPRRRRRRRV